MLDTSKPVTNPELSKALERLHKNNIPENQNQVLDEVLMRAHFLAPVVLPGKDRESKGDIQFQMVSSKAGRPFFPAFTDWGELRKLCGPKDQQTMVLTFDDYAAILAAEPRVDGFVINPLGHPLTLSRENIAQLAKEKQARAGYSRNVIDKNTKVRLWDSKDVPQAMLEAICSAVEPMEDVSRLFLRMMARDGQERPSYLIVVDHQGEQDEVFKTIANAARPHLEGKLVEMALFDSPFGKAAAENVQPFYERKAD